MSERSSIRLVCFDLGGVIIRICRTWPEGLRAAGLPMRDGLAERLERAMNDLRGLIYEHQTGRMTCDLYALQFSELLDGLYTPQEVHRVHMAWLLEQYDGADAVVDALNRGGMTTAALSNTNASHWTEILTYPAVDLLQHRFASHEIGEHKPDDGAYAHVEDSLGLRGSEVLFFDDLPENIAAAQQRGWNAVQIDHAGDTASQMRAALAEFRVSS